jgi:cytoskeletal protein RodZ
MNKLIVGIILAVSLASVVGAALGWMYPFHSKTVNQINSTEPSPTTTASSSETNTQAVKSAPNTTATETPPNDPSATVSEEQESVPALW